MNATLLTQPRSRVASLSDWPRTTLLRSDECDLWDHFVASAPAGHLLQSWSWGELKRAFGWEPRRVAFWDPTFRHIQAGAQVLLRPLPFSRYSMAYLPKGPVLDWSDIALTRRFFSELHAILRQERVAFLRLEPDLSERIELATGEQDEAPSDALIHACEAAIPGGERYGVALGRVAARNLSTMGFQPVPDRIQPRRTIVVDLTADEPTLLQRQKTRWRYNIRLAERKGITIRPAQNLDDVRAWYDLLEITRQRNRFAGHPYAYYRRAWELLEAKGQVKLFLAEHEGKLLAGAFVTLVGQQAIYLYGASGNEDRQLKPNYLLQWEAMRWAKSQGATFYDMWGIANTDDPADPQAGLTAFKSGWGGQVIEFLSGFDYVYDAVAYRAFLAERRLMKAALAMRAALRGKRRPAKGMGHD
jgi:peptidoglycan pentaglycine glycine transferase (the first glycine)